MYELLLKGGIVVDPSQNLHDRRDVAISKGKIAAVEHELNTAEAERVIDASNHIVTPGLVDLHVHVYEGVGMYGLSADSHCLPTGVTSAVDAGTAGADTFPSFRRHILEKSKTRLKAFIHISTTGLARLPELERVESANVERTARACETNQGVIRGVKVRLTRSALGKTHPIEAFALAKETAEKSGLSLMVHGIRTNEKDLIGDTTVGDILAGMRKGDIFTHTFAEHSGILDEDGRVTKETLRAQSRGVIFDVGHGIRSFSFDVAGNALSQGFEPTTISSDMHKLSYMRSMYDLATTLSKFLALGLSLDRVVEKATVQPARVLSPDETVGTLLIDAPADLVIFRVLEDTFTFTDVVGKELTGNKCLSPRAVVRNGEVYLGGSWSQLRWHHRVP